MALAVKDSPANAGDLRAIFSPWVGTIPGGGNGNSPVVLPGESRRQRSPAIYSPKGHKESDTTEATYILYICNYTHICIHIHIYVYIHIHTFIYLYTCTCYAVLFLVAQSCPTLCHPMDCSPQGSSVHEDSPSKNTGVGCHALLQGIFTTQR